MTSTMIQNFSTSIRVVMMISALTGAFAFYTPLATAPSSITSRSATVVQRYRVENDFPNQPDHHLNRHDRHSNEQQQSKDVFSLLPERVSIQRLATPSDFQTQVVDEKSSLVVVRFYADTCPSCRATSSVFRKWSRGIANSSDNNSDCTESTIPIKVFQMPLTKATSSFLQDELKVEQIPYCHLYHPDYGLIEEQLVMNRSDLKDFCNTVLTWSAGGCDYDLEADSSSDCKEFC